uniref:ADP-dependent NAD(P)H-hydrate dehydratase n=1 Tax=Alloprevotella sp. TaxID=1872471 RepID=UPI004025A7A2
GQDKRTALAFIEQTSHTEAPLIIDADGINILGSHKGWISQIPQQTILTPHPKEMQRLGICNSDSYSILLEAINMAQRHRFFICLKGHYTAICTPEGKVYFNPTGNSGMATAGSGDVLTGIILSLIAQGYNQENACLLGIYLHGLAGDYAAMALGEQSVVASDLIAYLPEAFKALEAPSTDEDTNSIKAL